MPTTPLEPEDARQIGRYRLTGRLGEGGQGVVYLAEDPGGQLVAIKVLKTTSAEARSRFLREMNAARQVAPFCTAAVLESSVEGSHPYVVSEYVDGPSLQKRVAEQGPMRGGELERLVVNTASAMAAIHGAGIVHRDLKPANVLLGPDGPRVVDFGIARAIDAETNTQMVGTPAYFAPEWLRGEQPTPASDVFAWAGTMLFAATGRPPFGQSTTLAGVMHRIATAEPDLTGAPDSLRAMLAECLDKDPARRPAARDLLVRLVDPTADTAPPIPMMATAPPQGPPANQAPRPGHPPMPHQAAPIHGQYTQPAGWQQNPPQAKKSRVVPILVGAGVLVVVALVAGFLIARSGDSSQKQAESPKTSTSSTAETSDEQPTTVPKAFAGTWKGNLKQESVLGEATPTALTINLDAGAKTGKADYVDWKCKGTLTVVSASATVVEFSETTSGKATCMGGSVKLTLADKSLKYESGGGFGTSSGTLRKS